MSLCFASARDLRRMLDAREISAPEVMQAHLDQIERVNPTVNAIVAKLDDDRCVELAREADVRVAARAPLGPLDGFPTAFKDTGPAAGFPHTMGSPIFKDVIATEDSLVVERMRNAGVLPIGKTNVPEFGLGSHTYNTVYGTTVNPYDTTKSAGGSSGGAAAALATGMLPVADGSDLGGSLRNPANFNNVVALRPTPGLVPQAPSTLPLLPFAVQGPMGRSVGDVAMLLSVIAGPHPRDPSSYPCDASIFAQPLDVDVRGVRVAWCPDLGGLPLDPRVRAVLDMQRATFESLGCVVEDASPDLDGANDVFMTVRAWIASNALRPLYEQHRDRLKPEAVWQIEQGLELTGDDVHRALVRHGEILHRMGTFEETYAFLLCAVNQVPPFDASLDWPKEVDGVAMENYVAWMKSASWITTTFRPAISVPAGFTSEGLPVGIQIVGRHRADLSVLQLAHAFEQATGFGTTRPTIAAVV